MQVFFGSPVVLTSQDIISLLKASTPLAHHVKQKEMNT